jgi:hypothetical protein
MLVLSITAFVIAVLLMIKRSQTRVAQTWLMILAGAGIAGLLGQWIDKLSGWGASLSSTATGQAFGGAVPWAVALVVAAWVFFDLGIDDRLARLRKGKGAAGRGIGGGVGAGRNIGAVSRATPWLGLLVPAALVALAGLPSQLWTGAQQLAAQIGG